MSQRHTNQRLAKHAAAAGEHCPSMRAKKVTPHALRHTAAMRLLKAGIDTTVIALWLGHGQVDATHIYLHADLAIKEQALARTASVDGRPGRYRPPDSLLAFLEALWRSFRPATCASARSGSHRRRPAGGRGSARRSRR